ncbi:MAG: serine/threonine protein kinase [Oleibacter sp.]|nr:serine/threonine protein kinase [Thalassolituus sp.]
MNTHPYSQLTPELVMDAIESVGYVCDCRNITLNSYENRVYQIGLEEDQPIIAKFYRPERWSREAILEEHAFLLELEESDVPVISPIIIGGETLFTHEGFSFALFPRRGGHAPELGRDSDLEIVGRWLGRIHLVGNQPKFKYRQSLLGSQDIRAAAETVLASNLMPEDYCDVYQSLIRDICAHTDAQTPLSEYSSIRLHGDMHMGNLLLRDQQLWITDFDDCLQGPAMQDIWMMLSGSTEEHAHQLNVLASGYETFRPFPTNELPLIEMLRTRRIVRYAAWLCQRWDDPAFPLAFPWFEGHRFWSEHLLSLREQLAALQEPPLSMSFF